MNIHPLLKVAISNAFGGMIGVLVSAINQPTQFKQVVTGLGVRHQVYGIQPDHFRIMYSSLTRTFSQLLGSKVTLNYCIDIDALCSLQVNTKRHGDVSTIGWLMQCRDTCMTLPWVNVALCAFSILLKALIVNQRMIGEPGGKFKHFHCTLTNFRLFLTKKQNDPSPKLEIDLGNIVDVYEAQHDLGNPKYAIIQYASM
jgi:hypothetical protein